MHARVGCRRRRASAASSGSPSSTCCRSGRRARPPLPPGETSLLAATPLAAALANLISNLPAVLVLLSLAAPSGAGLLLAVLLWVNIGPNLT